MPMQVLWFFRMYPHDSLSQPGLFSFYHSLAHYDLYLHGIMVIFFQCSPAAMSLHLILYLPKKEKEQLLIWKSPEPYLLHWFFLQWAVRNVHISLQHTFMTEGAGAVGEINFNFLLWLFRISSVKTFVMLHSVE